MSKFSRYRQRLKERAEQIHGDACKHCGKRSKLEYAHVQVTTLRGQGRGLQNRYLDIINNPQCYIRLCQQCHRIYDEQADTSPATCQI